MTTDTKLIAYHGDPKLKRRIMAQVWGHRKADEIAQGAYYHMNGGLRVCAVGCVLHDPDGGHEQYESEFGIPAQLAYLEDSIFEALPLDVAKDWPVRFMGAIKSGADLARVWPGFAAWLMLDDTYGLVNITEAKDVKEVCQQVGDAYTRIAAGEDIPQPEVDEITKAAWAAWAAWDAWDAWDAWVARAAWDARDAWDAWVARAAWDARDAWVARVARDAWVIASADKLVELLGKAPRA